MLTALFVAARIIANPVSNVFQKQLTQRSANPIFIIGATHGLLTLATLPLLFGPVKLAHGAEFYGPHVNLPQVPLRATFPAGCNPA